MQHSTLRNRYAAHGLATLAALGLTAAPAHAQTTITSGPRNSSFSTGSIAIAQSFTAPTDSVLHLFSFQFLNNQTPLQLSVYAWNPSSDTATGNALYTSGTATGQLTDVNTQIFTFDTGGVTLTSGGQYAAFLVNQVSDTFLSPYTTSYTAPADGYTGGAAYSSGSLTFDPHQTFVPASSGQNTDLAFTATFDAAAAPEPSEWAALGFTAISVSGLLLRARRRVKNRQ